MLWLITQDFHTHVAAIVRVSNLRHSPRMLTRRGLVRLFAGGTAAAVFSESVAQPTELRFGLALDRARVGGATLPIVDISWVYRG